MKPRVPKMTGAAIALLVVPAMLLASTQVAGQADPDDVRRLERQLSQLREIETSRLRGLSEGALGDRLLLDYGGSVRFGLVGIDNEFGNTRILRQTDALMYLRAELDGAHRFVGRLRFRYNDFNSGDSFDGQGDELDEPIVDRYWYEFDLGSAHLAQTGTPLDYGFRVRAGRQYIEWGSGLSLSNALYAAVVEAEYEDFGIEALVGLTTPSSTIDFDATRPGFDDDTDRAYFGAKLEYRGFRDHRPYLSFLAQRDDNTQNFGLVPYSLDPLVLVPTSFAYDSEYFAIGSRGTLGPQMLYHAEIVHETGSGLSNSYDADTDTVLPQTFEDIDAWAAVVGLTFLPRDDNNIRAEFEFIYGSGDSDRLDPGDTLDGNRSGTNDESFNALGYVHTGLALAPDVSNLLCFRAGWSISPSPRLVKDGWMRVGIDGFLFAKADADAQMNFHTESGKSFLGGEIDLSLDWRLSSDMSASFRYGVLFPGNAMPDGEDSPRHFFYTGVTYAF